MPMSAALRIVAMATAVAFLAATSVPTVAEAKPVKRSASAKSAKTSQKPRCDIYLCAAGSEPPSAGK
jgi:hypothetical protein